MTLLEAISVRASQRTYLSRPLEPVQLERLRKALAECNRRSGLRIQLVCPTVSPFAGQGRLEGARDYLLFAGPAEDPDLEEKCGYWGEELVLTATAMGLGTCWVGGTYDRRDCLARLDAGETLVCVAALGVPDGAPAHRALRPAGELVLPADCPAPAWFDAGVDAVRRAPSAMNRQGYRFHLRPGGAVQARLSGGGSFALVDLGIAKRHFQLGAHGGTWTWGDGGMFRKAEEEKSCGAVIWRSAQGGREYLLACHNGGHWSFPKGHVEGQETERETAEREIREETGLLADIDTGFRRVVTYSPAPGIVKDVVFFTATPAGGAERRQEEEIAQLGWFSFRDACALVTFATDEEVLLAAEEYLSGR